MTDDIVCRTTLRQLLGRRINDPDGQPVGHIEEIRARSRDGVLEVEEVTVGAYGAMRRIASGPVWRLFLDFFGIAGHRPRVIPWDWLDLSDPLKPTLLWPRSELPEPGERPSGRSV